MDESLDIQKVIETFPYLGECHDSNFCMGNCDHMSIAFLSHAERYGFVGILLAIDNPLRAPSFGWNVWGGDWRRTGSAISHYVAYFPALDLVVDFTARQFWKQSPVPMMMDLEQLQSEWDQMPYGISDARNHEVTG